MNNKNQIVIIEDEPSQRILLKKVIENLGYACLDCGDGKSGLAAIEKVSPSLVILDLGLPDISGFSVLKKIKGNPEMKNTQVMILTSETEEEIAIEGLILGAADFLIKPVRSHELRARIKNILTSQRLEKENEALMLEIKNETQIIEKENSVLSKYFSRNLVQGILNGDISTEIGGTIETCTVLFFQIKNPQALEKFGDEDLALRISGIFGEIGAFANDRGGSTINFFGDRILIAFGVPKKLTDPGKTCLLAAWDMHRFLENLNAMPKDADSYTLKYGIGIASGSVFAGHIGAYHKLDYTILGDAVNLASRLCSLTENVQTNILVDDETIAEFHDLLELEYKPLKVKGKVQNVKAYALNGIGILDD